MGSALMASCTLSQLLGPVVPWQGWEGKRRKVLVQPSVPPAPCICG